MGAVAGSDTQVPGPRLGHSPYSPWSSKQGPRAGARDGRQGAEDSPSPSKGGVGSGHPKTPSQPRQGAGVGSSWRVGCFPPLPVFSWTVCLGGRPPNQTHPHGSRGHPTPCSPNTGAKVGRWEAQLKSKSQIHSLKEKKRKSKKKKNHDKTMCK